MRHRKSDYRVLLGRKFTLSQWQYLEDSFARHPERARYRLSPIGRMTESVFSISHVDHSYFKNAEIGALYNFFEGVVCSAGFPSESTPGGF